MERETMESELDAVFLESADLSAEERFTDLYCSCYGLVQAYFVRAGCPYGDLEDLTQEVFTRMWRRYEEIMFSEEQARAYLFGIARNVARERHQKNRLAGDPLRSACLQDSTPTPLERVQLLERAEAVRRAVAMLPAAQRQAIELVELDGQTPAQAAQQDRSDYRRFRYQRQLGIRNLSALLKIFFMLDFLLQLAQ